MGIGAKSSVGEKRIHEACAGRNGLDFIDDFHAFDDFTEDGIAVAAAIGVIEIFVIGDIDKELGRSGIRIGTAGHGEGAFGVALTLWTFVFDFLVGFGCSRYKCGVYVLVVIVVVAFWAMTCFGFSKLKTVLKKKDFPGP